MILRQTAVVHGLYRISNGGGRWVIRKDYVAEAEAVENVEGNMLCTVMQGVTALPWSETPLRLKGKRRNLGDLTSPIPASAVLGHDGKSIR